ncbi:acaloleptin A-like [Coccinella septempunctata]|uniref:acaloleptin A-like n=1 Tax=Coccinella septempunctata TaxID=41139 RepID=UPI001D094153|nr:acaloleptin A-like [Coccinella septempunctata]
MVKMIFFLCLVFFVAIVQAGPVSYPEPDNSNNIQVPPYGRIVPFSSHSTLGYSKIMKVFPHDRNIPLNSRHVRATDDGWQVEPNVNRDADGNTAGSVRVQKNFGDHEVHAGASRVFSGPNRGGPSYNIGATFRW